MLHNMTMYSILLAGTGVWKISYVGLALLKSIILIISRINEVYVFQ